ncbi:PIN domain-containing protein [Streptomyces graminilatus]|uniref:PIN domain-containing protein n=1 Tax=Streptomyces graminilatus TaxID=1464070 RepID=UPI0006E1CDB5|nr:PIN domain-containing protein [Streptomyces graminilatus]
MIILDTNILRSIKLDSVSAELIRTIRTAEVESVGVPWVVLEELASHRAVPYREKHEAAAEALKNFRKATPWQTAALLPPLDLERYRQHWRLQYLEIVDEIPTSEYALREAAFRESNVLPPCKAIVINERDKVKTGGRDAAIWLAAVEYAREHPDETVYFVSKNTKDFGDGTAYPSLMAMDLDGLGERFVHLTSLGQVLQRFTVSAEVKEEEVRAILSDTESLKTISVEAARLMAVTKEKVWFGGGPRISATMAFLAEDLGSGEFETVTTEPVEMLGWAEVPTVALGSVGELSAHRIGDHVWCAATVRWILSGPAVLQNTHRVEVVGCAWETRVLASTTNTDSRLTILRSQAARALTTSEFVSFAPSATLLAKRTERARQKWLPLDLKVPEDSGQETFRRLSRVLHSDAQSPWFAAPRYGNSIQYAELQVNDGSLWFAPPREDDDPAIQFAEPEDGDGRE